MSSRKIVIPGGSGHVGTILARSLHEAGDDVVVLSRRPEALRAPWRAVGWDGRSLGAWTRELDGCDAVINLAGRSVDCRYHARNRREILSSRVESTAVLGEAIAAAPRPPRVWLQASTATIYAHRFDAPNDEASGILGGEEPGVPETWRFSIDVARAWERAAVAARARTPATRQVIMRTAIVMAPGAGGPFDVHARLVRLGLGGRFGDGRQHVSWIHDVDLVRVVEIFLTDDAWSGVVNVAAPHPLPNADFMRALRAAFGMPFGLPSPAWLLEIGTFLLRSETELVLKSRRVVPGRLLDAGFRFEHPSWLEAARDLARRRTAR